MNHVTTFKQLVDSIQTLHQDLTNQIGKAVNIGLTLRNWLIGGYINDYELQGGDRAEYGERLFDELSQALHGISNCNRRQLYRYLRFYRFYPAFVGTLPPQLPLLPALESILQKVGTTSPQSAGNPPLMTRLSYSHFDLLVDIDDATKRSFYEIECLRGNWSVRELKRQIGNLYYERSGLSIDKLKLAELAQQSVEPQALFNIRDPYLFEFLGLKPAEVMSESQLEDQLLGKLQAFLLELGHGFCFESRQKRILLPRSHAPRGNAGLARVAGFLAAARQKLGSHAARGNQKNKRWIATIRNFRTTAADGKVCRMDKRSASTSTVLNPVDARCLSTLPPSTQRQAMNLLGFIAFNPAYDLENSVVKESLTTAADGKVCRVDKRSASTFQMEKGGRQ